MYSYVFTIYSIQFLPQDIEDDMLSEKTKQDLTEFHQNLISKSIRAENRKRGIPIPGREGRRSKKRKKGQTPPNMVSIPYHMSQPSTSSTMTVTTCAQQVSHASTSTSTQSHTSSSNPTPEVIDLTSSCTTLTTPTTLTISLIPHSDQSRGIVIGGSTYRITSDSRQQPTSLTFSGSHGDQATPTYRHGSQSMPPYNLASYYGQPYPYPSVEFYPPYMNTINQWYGPQSIAAAYNNPRGEMGDMPGPSGYNYPNYYNVPAPTTTPDGGVIIPLNPSIMAEYLATTGYHGNWPLSASSSQYYPQYGSHSVTAVTGTNTGPTGTNTGLTGTNTGPTGTPAGTTGTDTGPTGTNSGTISIGVTADIIGISSTAPASSIAETDTEVQECASFIDTGTEVQECSISTGVSTCIEEPDVVTTTSS